MNVLTSGLVAILAVLALASSGLLSEPAREPKARAILREQKLVVRTLAFSADGRTLTSCGLRGRVTFWDHGSGNVRTLDPGEDLPFARTLLSPGGRLLATENLDASITLWDLTSGRRLADIPQRSGPTSGLAFTADASVLALSGKPGVQLWETASERPRRICYLPERDSQALAFAPGDRTLAVGGYGGSISIWDTTTGRRINTFRAHEGPVSWLAFDDRGRVLASACSIEKVARLWDAAGGRFIASLEGHALGVTCAVFTPGGRMVATASGDQTVRLWDPSTGRLLETFSCQDGPFTRVVVSPDGRLLAGGGNGSIRVWSLEQGDPTALRASPPGPTSTATTRRLDPDGAELADQEPGGIPGHHGSRGSRSCRESPILRARGAPGDRPAQRLPGRRPEAARARP